MSLSVTLTFGEGISFDESLIKKTRCKGKSIVGLPDEYVLLDVETTGLSPCDDEIIELAFVKIKNNVEVDRFQTLIKPLPQDFYLDDLDDEETNEFKANNIPIFTDENGEQYFRYYVDEFISNLTGITNEMLSSAPEFEEIAQQAYNFLGKNILVGYNVNFDVNFLYDKFEMTLNKNLQNDFIDVLRIARKILPDLPNHKLVTVAKHFNIGGNNHRALSDCLITNAVYEKLKEILTEENFDLIDLFKKKTDNISVLTADGSEFDKDHVFYKKNCVFTGKLDKMSRTQAAQLVVNIGGIAQSGINKETNFLILGNIDYAKNIKEGKSNKLKKAEKLILNGQALQIINENVFYELIFNL